MIPFFYIKDKEIKINKKQCYTINKKILDKDMIRTAGYYLDLKYKLKQITFSCT